MATTTVIGATGLVGTHIVSALLGLDAVATVHTITRRAPAQAADAAVSSGGKLDAVVETDTTQWAAKLQAAVAADVKNKAAAEAPAAGGWPAVFSALGTTRAAAGGIANQWKIDHDLNVELARAAKAAGVRTFVFVSSAGVRAFPSRAAPYSRMKIGVEDAIRELGFDQAIVLHPGLILGDRGAQAADHKGAGLLKALTRAVGAVSTAWHDTMAQDADVIAKAAVHAALLAADGKAPAKYWDVSPSDIVRLGRDEWKF